MDPESECTDSNLSLVTSCVIWGKILSLFVPQCLTYKMRIKILPHEIV